MEDFKEFQLARKTDNEGQYIEQPKGSVEVSVRTLVEFILRYGDIDNRRSNAPENAMQAGSRIHRMIQKKMGSEYTAEVPLVFTMLTDKYALVVQGRADGIIEKKDEIIIDEIKGTYKDVNRLKKPMEVHLAQAKCYAYMFGVRRDLKTIGVRMTYCNYNTEEIRYFEYVYDFEELTKWFMDLLGEYRKWADYTYVWRQIRQNSIADLEFPFDYREGQHELAAYVYQTIYHEKKLFLEAPTGVGKTITTLFPSIKAMGKDMGDKIFYLTAKTITRTVAENTLDILREKGLKMKSVVLTAKEKACFMEKPECNPERCPYAKGHYDRVNACIYDMLVHEERFSREVIEEYSRRYQVCPFETCLDMSLFADAIIGDYNYLFDPHVYLKRFFAEGGQKNYTFLIDEAHNLLDRGREMYSATVIKEDLMELKRELKTTIMSEITEHPKNSQIKGQMTFELTNGSEKNESEKTSGYGGKWILIKKGYWEKIEYQLEKANKEMLALKRECQGARLVDSIDKLVLILQRLHTVIDDYLDETEEEAVPIKESILDMYFNLSHFLDIYERLDENYIKYTQLNDDGSFMLKLFCVNPSVNLAECMGKGRSSILFSATFLPIQYYKSLLGGEDEDYEVYAKSVFNPEKLSVYIAEDVTSKYTRRGPEEYERIAHYISEIIKTRSGNYMVFCPSFAFMRSIYEAYVDNFSTDEEEIILQTEGMNEADREEFLLKFRGNPDADLEDKINMKIEFEENSTLVGFCVMGGIFSEGIDLKNDSLIGAIIVGTGLPQVCPEREFLKDYFDENGENGFDYAYRFPGMNKVLQAAGRVIRTVDDIGVVALLDERFLQGSYSRMFPREWRLVEKTNVFKIGIRMDKFWDSWSR